MCVLCSFLEREHSLLETFSLFESGQQAQQAVHYLLSLDMQTSSRHFQAHISHTLLDEKKNPLQMKAKIKIVTFCYQLETQKSQWYL